MKKQLFLLLLTPLTLSVLYACANTNSMARKHPMEVTGMPNCGECHSDQLKSMDHQAPDFYKKHGRFAGANQNTCGACHTRSFCSDCHTRKDELKPSLKHSGSPERIFPHRADYLTQHKIDGRINPASCAKCHGRQNNARCSACHR